MYTIGQVSKMFGLSISTLRYYDKEGLIPELNKDPSGIRRFDDQSVESIRVIECLKKSGMQIKEIREFMDWCIQGDQTLEKRKEMFFSQRKNILKKMQELQKTLDMVEFKCWYYEAACKDETEANLKENFKERMPEKIRECYRNAHDS